MSDVTEHDLREAFAARVETVAPRIIDRVSHVDFRQSRRRVPLLTKIGATAGGIAAAATAAVLSLTAGTQVAFAGWTATPSTASAASVTATRTACGHVAAADVLASEARGPYTAIVFLRGDRPWQCVAKGPRVVVDLSTPYPLRVYSTVPSERVMVPLVSQRVFGKTLKRLNQSSLAATWSDSKALAVMTGPGSVSIALGVAGNNVNGVTLTLKDGQEVRATVEHGWYVAWWPGAPKRGGGETTRITVTTSSGTHSSRLPASAGRGTYRLSGKGCFPGDACSVLVPLGLTPGVAPILRRHFALFTDTPAVNWSAEPHALRSLIEDSSFGGGAGSRSVLGEVQMENGVNYGLDLAQVRELRLGRNDSLWLIPGTEGYCEDLVLLDAVPGGGNLSESGCSPIQELLHNGYIQAVSGDGASYPYSIGGFVPDGNDTIAVRLDSGATRVVQVRHNTFVANFQAQPAAVKFNDASGRAITEPVHTSQ